MKYSDLDIKYMKYAIDLAKKTNNPLPNPYVGAIFVKKNKIVGKGFHKAPGLPHAERNAIADAGKEARGATLYINLEPCAHYGKTPPCTQGLIQAKIKEAVIAIKDPNPIVNGKGIKELEKAGIKVRIGVLQEEAKKLNEIYIKYISKKMPFVLLKSAHSIDGKICSFSGDSKWITEKQTRIYAKKLRSGFDAVLVGINTVLKDDPMLNAAKPKRSVQSTKNTYKVIVDSKAKIPVNSRIFQDPSRVIIATTEQAPAAKVKKLERLGVKVISVNQSGSVDLKRLMKKLAEMEIASVFIEGGGEINASAIGSGIVDKVIFFVAPKIIGGRDAKTSVEGSGIEKISRAIKLKNISVKKIGRDLILEGYL